MSFCSGGVYVLTHTTGHTARGSLSRSVSIQGVYVQGSLSMGSLSGQRDRESLSRSVSLHGSLSRGSLFGQRERESLTRSVSVQGSLSMGISVQGFSVQRERGSLGCSVQRVPCKGVSVWGVSAREPPRQKPSIQ